MKWTLEKINPDIDINFHYSFEIKFFRTMKQAMEYD